MMIVTEESGHHVILRLPSEFNFKIQRAFRDCYRHRPPGLFYHVDFRDVIHIDSSALGMLLLLRSHNGDSPSSIQLINCSGEVRKILEVAKFDTFFHIP